MKTLISTLLGSGALGLLLVAYLALTSRQEVRQEINTDKTHFEQEASKFDQSFERKWQAFDRTQATKARREPSATLIRDALTERPQVPEKVEDMPPATQKALAELKATLGAAGNSR